MSTRMVSGTLEHDRAEAYGIHEALGDVPVTAPKSFFGNLGAATGAVELAVSLLAIDYGQIPATLNYARPDPECPINIVHTIAANLREADRAGAQSNGLRPSGGLLLAAP